MDLDPIVAFVEALDRCWQARRFADLGNFFAEDAVLVAPGGRARLEGRAAAVDSYRDFMERAEVTRYAASEPLVTQRGDTAVVEYGWEMDWGAGGEVHTAKGREVLVLNRRDGQWQAVWRTQIAD